MAPGVAGNDPPLATVVEAEPVQPFPSVITTVYVPGTSELIDCVVGPFDYEYV